MINGYEYLYKEEDGKKPKYVLRNIDKLAHNLDGSGKQNHLGVTSSEAYANLIEQNIGKKFYEKMSIMYADYVTLYRTVLSYQKNKQAFDSDAEGFELYNKKHKEFSEEKKLLESKINGILNSKDSNKGRQIQDLATKLEEIETNIDNNRCLLQFSEEQYSKSKKVIDEQFKTITRFLKFLKDDLSKLDKDKCNEIIKKFTSSKFQMQIEQEFVDTMLLPGEEKKEGNVRIIAQTLFEAYKLEARCLVSMDSAIKDLVDCVEGQIKSTDLPDIYVDAKSQGKYEILYGLKSVSTDVIENHQNRFESKNFCQFYQDVFKMMKESSYGKNPSSELYNLPEFAMQSHKFKNTSKRNGEDLDINTDIFNGVQHLLEGNVYNSEGIEL